MIRIVKNRIERNRKIARELNISRKMMQFLLKIELGIKPLKQQKVKVLIDAQKISKTGNSQGVVVVFDEEPF